MLFVSVSAVHALSKPVHDSLPTLELAHLGRLYVGPPGFTVGKHIAFSPGLEKCSSHLYSNI